MLSESRCLHDMLILNGRPTCSLCLGLDDRAAIAAAGFTAADGTRPAVTSRQHLDDLADVDDVNDLADVDDLDLDLDLDNAA